MGISKSGVNLENPKSTKYRNQLSDLGSLTTTKGKPLSTSFFTFMLRMNHIILVIKVTDFYQTLGERLLYYHTGNYKAIQDSSVLVLITNSWGLTKQSEKNKNVNVSGGEGLSQKEKPKRRLIWLMVCESENDTWCTQRVWSKESLQAPAGAIQTDNNIEMLFSWKSYLRA